MIITNNNNICFSGLEQLLSQSLCVYMRGYVHSSTYSLFFWVRQNNRKQAKKETEN